MIAQAARREAVRVSPATLFEIVALHTAGPDPLDRLLVATARQLDATFLTGDSAVLAYAAQTHNVRVHDLTQ